MRRLAIYCLTLLLAACNLNPVSEPNNIGVTVIPTRTLSLEDVETTEDSSQEGLNATLAPLPILGEETDEACTPPADWYEYTVERGDNLSRIAQSTNSTVDELIAANCLDDPNRIRVGDTIRVPNEPD